VGSRARACAEGCMLACHPDSRRICARVAHREQSRRGCGRRATGSRQGHGRPGTRAPPRPWRAASARLAGLHRRGATPAPPGPHPRAAGEAAPLHGHRPRLSVVPPGGLAPEPRMATPGPVQTHHGCTRAGQARRRRRSYPKNLASCNVPPPHGLFRPEWATCAFFHFFSFLPSQ
jgi:hypothetical protein